MARPAGSPEMFEEAKADGRMEVNEKFAQMPMGGNNPGTNAGNEDYTKKDTSPDVHPLDDMESSMGVHDQSKSFFNQKHRR